MLKGLIKKFRGDKEGENTPVLSEGHDSKPNKNGFNSSYYMRRVLSAGGDIVPIIDERLQRYVGMEKKQVKEAFKNHRVAPRFDLEDTQERIEVEEVGVTHVFTFDGEVCSEVLSFRGKQRKIATIKF